MVPKLSNETLVLKFVGILGRKIKYFKSNELIFRKVFCILSILSSRKIIFSIWKTFLCRKFP